MPVDDHPVHDKTKQKKGAKNGCHNRKPFKDTLMVKDGFTEDGRQKFKDVPFVMSRDCQYDNRKDPMCRRCKWKPKKGAPNGVSK